MPSAGNYYTDFNYRDAYGDNPFTATTSTIGSLIDRMSSSGPQGSSGASSGASYGSWGINVARADDPEVASYMENVLGGQRKTLDEYVRQAAGAGIKRGGMNVVGGPALDSALHHQAMSTLAAGYADRFTDAMNYNKYLKGAQYDQYNDNLRNLQSMLGLQHQYLSSQSDWQNRLGDTMHGDWKGDVDWDRQEPERDLQLEQTKRAMAMQKNRDTWAVEDRQRALDDKMDRNTRWTQYLNKAAQVELAGKTGAGWTFADEAQAERLGVEMGYLKPWDRSYSISISKK